MILKIYRGVIGTSTAFFMVWIDTIAASWHVLAIGLVTSTNLWFLGVCLDRCHQAEKTEKNTWTTFTHPLGSYSWNVRPDTPTSPCMQLHITEIEISGIICSHHWPSCSLGLRTPSWQSAACASWWRQTTSPSLKMGATSYLSVEPSNLANTRKKDLNSISLETIHSHPVKFGYTAYDIEAKITSNMSMVSLAKKNSFRHTGAPKRVPKLLKKSRWNTPFPTQIDSAACIASHPWKQQVTSIFSCHMFNSGLER